MNRTNEHYPDPTFDYVWRKQKQDAYRGQLGRLKRALKQAKKLFEDYGFIVWRPIVLKDKATGRIFDGPK